MASIIIGLLGKKQSGKDTVAARLVAEHNFSRIAFADPLKEIVADLDPWVRIEADEAGLLYGPGSVPSHNGPEHARLTAILKAVGWDTAKQLREVRRLLQAQGVAVRDHLYRDAWVDAAEGAVEAVPGPVVITDVRFLNEADFIEANGELVRVVRPGLVSDDAHVSENELNHYRIPGDYTVVNDGTLADLDAKVDAVLANIKYDYPFLF